MQLDQLSAQFKALDKDSTGTIKVSELAEALKKLSGFDDLKSSTRAIRQ